MGDGDVSVHADDDQVEDAGGAGPDVHTEPYEAEIPGNDDKSVSVWWPEGEVGRLTFQRSSCPPPRRLRREAVRGLLARGRPQPGTR